jgi:hypothetical protein
MADATIPHPKARTTSRKSRQSIKGARNYYVYIHRRLTDGGVFYVGKGQSRRAWDMERRNPYWRNVEQRHGRSVEIVIADVQEWYALELEMDLIAYYGRENLCNLTDGGEGATGYFPGEETRKKMALAQIGKKHSDESKKKIVAALTGKKLSQSHRDNLSKSNRANPRNVGGTGKVVSDESRRRMSASATGRVMTTITKKKLAEAQVAIWARKKLERQQQTLSLF